jgi:hypothetical protein
MKYSQDDEALQPGLATTIRNLEAGGAIRDAAKAPNDSNERLDDVVRVLKVLMDNKFTGFIKLNFSQGTLGRVEKFEEILKK